MLYVSDVKDDGSIIVLKDTDSEDYERKFTEDDFFEEFYVDGDAGDLYDMREDVFGACFRGEDALFVIPQTKEDALRSNSIREKIKLDKVRRKLIGLDYNFIVRPVTNDIVVLFDVGGEVKSGFKIPKYVTCLGSFFMGEVTYYDEHLVIPDTVKYVAPYAFGELYELRSLKFEGNLKYLGGHILEYCNSEILEKVYLPSDIEVIDEQAFNLDMFRLTDLKNLPLKFIVPRSLYEKHMKVFSHIEIYNPGTICLEII